MRSLGRVLAVLAVALAALLAPAAAQGQAILAPNQLDLADGAAAQVDGSAGCGTFGQYLANADDVNGDGRADVVVGAPQANNSERPSSGSAYVVYGKAGGAAVGARDPGPRPRLPDRRSRHRQPRGHRGRAEPATDRNAAGTDVVVGAPANAGAVYIVGEGPNLTASAITDVEVISHPGPGTHAARIVSARASQRRRSGITIRDRLRRPAIVSLRLHRKREGRRSQPALRTGDPRAAQGAALQPLRADRNNATQASHARAIHAPQRTAGARHLPAGGHRARPRGVTSRPGPDAHPAGWTLRPAVVTRHPSC